MTNAKHTPAPWIFREELGTVNATDKEHSKDGIARIEVCDPSEGQTWNGGLLPIDEREANARLIAAAPELLAALIDARSIIEVLKRTLPLSDLIEIAPLSQIDAIDAAIAKANGE